MSDVGMCACWCLGDKRARLAMSGLGRRWRAGGLDWARCTADCRRGGATRKFGAGARPRVAMDVRDEQSVQDGVTAAGRARWN
jgi:hypothetical protein